MAEIRDELILDISRALREVDNLERALDRALVDTELRIDNQALEQTERLAQGVEQAFEQVEGQVTVTAAQFRQIVARMEEGETAARAIATATGRIEDEGAQVEESFRRVARSMDLSEDEARNLAQEMARSTRESAELDSDLRTIALSLNLSEEEARRFAASTRQAGINTAAAAASAEGLAVIWQRLRTLIITAVAAIGIRGLVNQFNEAVQASANLAESVNAVNVVFRSGSQQILDASEEAATRFGVSSRELNEAATRIGASLLNAGFDAREAADQFLILQLRATDTASVLNTDVNEVLIALQAALRGEFDPIERFTGGMNVAAVQARALELGLIGLNEELDNQARSQAVISLFLERTNRFAGDFANTSDSVANRQRQLTAALENTRAALGEALTPAFEVFLGVAQRAIIDIRAVSESIRTLAGAAEDASPRVTDLGDALGAFPRFAPAFLSDIVSFPVDLAQALGELGASFVPGVGGAERLDDALDNLLGTVDGFIDTLQQRAILERFILDLQEGVDPASAFATAVRDTAQANELTIESFRSLARIGAVSGGRLRDSIRVLLDLGEASGFSAHEMDVLRLALRQSFGEIGDLPPPLDELSRAMERNAEAAAAAVPLLSGFGEGIRTIADAGVDEIIDELEEQFDRLPGITGSAVEALRDDEGEIVEDFTEFLNDLQGELDKRQQFVSGVAVLRALGLDALADTFTQAGIEALPALDDALDNMGEAIAANTALENAAVAEGRAFTTALIGAIQDEIPASGLEIPLDVIAVIQNIRLPGAGTLLENLVIPSGVGAGRGTSSTTINFNTEPNPTTDTQRISQTVDALLR